MVCIDLIFHAYQVGIKTCHDLFNKDLNLSRFETGGGGVGGGTLKFGGAASDGDVGCSKLIAA